MDLERRMAALNTAALASSRPDSTLGVKRWNIVLEMLFNYSTIKLRASGEGEAKPNTRRERDVPQKVDSAYTSDAEVCFSRRGIHCMHPAPLRSAGLAVLLSIALSRILAARN
jgi:hypothetical protein